MNVLALMFSVFLAQSVWGKDRRTELFALLQEAYSSQEKLLHLRIGERTVRSSFSGCTLTEGEERTENDTLDCREVMEKTLESDAWTPIFVRHAISSLSFSQDPPL